MLTRRQVATRLGVSVAAVRRFEGNGLQPMLRDGRWLFEPDEVESLARLRASGGGRLSFPSADGDRNCAPAPRMLFRRRESHTPSSQDVDDQEPTDEAEHCATNSDPTSVDATGELLRTLDALSARQRRRFLLDQPEILGLSSVRKALSLEDRLQLEKARLRAQLEKISGKDNAKALFAGAAAVCLGVLSVYAYGKWVCPSRER